MCYRSYPVENNGCPKVVAVDKSKLATDIELALRDVLFNFNKATVRPESYSKLDLAAQIIKSSQGGTYLLIGHTDKKKEPMLTIWHFLELELQK